MGRNYYGGIRGKFWAVQSSGALQECGAQKGCQSVCFISCGCDCEDQGKHSYCKDCYESYEEHIADVREESGEDTDEDTWVVCNLWEWTYSRDSFEEQGLPFIEKHQALFNERITSLTFNDLKHYEYTIEFVDGAEKPMKDDSILADLCMLKQIEHFFKENPDEEDCEWEAEY
jgi:hypothetical protein